MISGDVSPLNEPTFHCGSQDCTVVKKLLFEVTSTASQWQCARKLPCERTAPRMCDFPPQYPLLSLCGVVAANTVGAPSVTLRSWEDLLQRR